MDFILLVVAVVGWGVAVALVAVVSNMRKCHKSEQILADYHNERADEWREQYLRVLSEHDRAVDALRTIARCQVDSTLEKHRNEWKSAVKKANTLLKELEE